MINWCIVRIARWGKIYSACGRLIWSQVETLAFAGIRRVKTITTRWNRKFWNAVSVITTNWQLRLLVPTTSTYSYYVSYLLAQPYRPICVYLLYLALALGLGVGWFFYTCVFFTGLRDATTTHLIVFHRLDFAAHFTQMVWKSTKEAGFGMAKGRSGRVVIVANYHPAGNVIGQFGENVLPSTWSREQILVRPCSVYRIDPD